VARRRVVPGAGQEGLWDEPPPPEEQPSPCLYDSPARGLAARLAEFEAWKAQYGSFGSLRRAHAWCQPWRTDTASPPGRCQPAVLSVDLRTDGGPRVIPCTCQIELHALLYRGACRWCAWEGGPHGSENYAVEDACEHAWPCWRWLPVIATSDPDMASGASAQRAKDQWAKQVAAVYPEGWLEAGGPVRTHRNPGATRHVAGRTPFGGYDLGTTEAATPAHKSTAAAILGGAERRSAARERAHVPIDYSAAQKEHKRHMRALTVAINSKDPDRVVLACAAAVADWDKPSRAWPDNWSRWQRALDDSRPWNRSVQLEDLRGHGELLAS
jgi:Family of unknown function (DUF6349)